VFLIAVWLKMLEDHERSVIILFFLVYCLEIFG